MAENDNAREYIVRWAETDEVAALAVVSAHAGPVTAALASAGYTTAPLVVDHGAGEGLVPADIDLGAECTIEDHHPCDVKVAIAVATEVAEQAGLASYGKLVGIQQAGVVSEAEAESVLTAWAAEVHGSEVATAEQRDWAEVVASELWPETNKGE